jgi:hypothetical protein
MKTVGRALKPVKGSTMNEEQARRKEAHPLLTQVLKRLKLEDNLEYFFRIAYVWKFPNKQLPDSQAFRLELSEYKTFGIPPPYVNAYLVHLKNDQELPPPP